MPEAPTNCSLQNITVTSLTVHCVFNKSLEQELSHQFVLQLYNNSNNLIRNVTVSNYPHFKVYDLPPGFNLKLFVYTINKNGQSEKVQIVASTLVGEPRKLGLFAISPQTDYEFN